MSKFLFIDLIDCLREVWNRHKKIILSLIALFIIGLVLGACLNVKATYGWLMVIDTNSIIVIISSNNAFKVIGSLIGLQIILALIMFLLSIHRFLLPFHYIVVFIRAICGGLLIVVVVQTMSIVGVIHVVLFVIVQQILSLAILLSCTCVSLHSNIFTNCLSDRLRHMLKYYLIVAAVIFIYLIVNVFVLFCITKPLIALI